MYPYFVLDEILWFFSVYIFSCYGRIILSLSREKLGNLVFSLSRCSALWRVLFKIIKKKEKEWENDWLCDLLLRKCHIQILIFLMSKRNND